MGRIGVGILDGVGQGVGSDLDRGLVRNWVGVGWSLVRVG